MSADATKSAGDSRCYFGIAESCRFVAGAHCGALYDLKDGNVFSLDRSGRLIVEHCVAGRPWTFISQATNGEVDPDEVRPFLEALVAMHVGDFADSPVQQQALRVPSATPHIRKLWLEITPSCNLRCVHCYAGATSPTDGQRGSLGWAAWKRAISEASTYAPPWVQFLGGEPLLRGKDFLAPLLRHARAVGIPEIEVFTNGLLLDEEWAKIFLETDTRVAFSIYGKRAATHDRITGLAGSHRRLLHNIDMLARKGLPLRPGFVVMAENESEERETREWLSETFGADLANPDVIRCTPESRCSLNTHLSRSLWQRKLRTKAAFPSTAEDQFLRNGSTHPCLCGSLCIHHDGSVFPCVMDRVRKLGDVKQQSLAEILASETTRKVWHQALAAVSTCGRCEFRYACSDCRPEAAGIDMLLNGSEEPDFNAKYPCCLYEPDTGVWSETGELLDILSTISSVDRAPGAVIPVLE